VHVVNNYIIVISLLPVNKEVCTKQLLSVSCSAELCSKKVCTVSFNERAQPDLSGCDGLQKYVPGVYSKMCPGSSHEGSGGIRIKSEADSDGELVEDCRPMLFREMKAEREVSFISVCPLSGTFCTCL
jgi:hypothetical protein